MIEDIKRREEAARADIGERARVLSPEVREALVTLCGEMGSCRLNQNLVNQVIKKLVDSNNPYSPAPKTEVVEPESDDRFPWERVVIWGVLASLIGERGIEYWPLLASLL